MSATRYDWTKAPPEAMFATIDEDGQRSWHETRPTPVRDACSGGYWNSGDGAGENQAIWVGDATKSYPDWRDSLESRPAAAPEPPAPGVDDVERACAAFCYPVWDQLGDEDKAVERQRMRRALAALHPPASGVTEAPPAASISAGEGKEAVTGEELKRLREVEHRAWHMLDGAEDDGESIRVSREDHDYKRLCELLPEDHP